MTSTADMASPKVHHKLEVAHWHYSDTSNFRLSGWCHVAESHLQVIRVTTEDRLLATTPLRPRPDVRQHFEGAETALLTGFDLALLLFDPDKALTLSAISDDGASIPFATVNPAIQTGRGAVLGDYTKWAADFDPDPPSPEKHQSSGPCFSVILPVYNTPLQLLNACIASVRAQHYPHWELCIVDDASSNYDILVDLVQRAEDPRIKLQRQATNGGISRTTNEALAMAKGAFVVFLDHDDILRPHALAQFAHKLGEEPDLDVIYSDEDKITSSGKRLLPFFKPDFSPEFLRGVMYFGHALCVRTELVRTVGGFDPRYDGVQDYEFALRLTEYSRRISHIPRILYHWRQIPGSSALEGNAKGNMDKLQLEAVQAHLVRKSDPRHAIALGGHRVSILATEIHAYETIQLAHHEDPLVQLFNAASRCSEDIILAFSSAIDTSTRGCIWPSQLASLASRTDSGAVAPILLMSNERVFAAGWIESDNEPKPCMHGFDPDSDGYNGSLKCNREVSLVAPLCVAIRRAILLEFPKPYMDGWWNFCRALRRQGLYNRICATARVRLIAPWDAPPLTHRPSSQPDPYFNPNFDPNAGDYRLCFPKQREPVTE